MTDVAHIDYETRSRVDLTSVGEHRYAIDPSTEIFMASISRTDSKRILLWINPKFATPDLLGDNEEAEDILSQSRIFKAHSAPFEQAITWGAFAQGKPCPFKQEPPLESWRCTAAVARKAGLPWSLEKLGETLKLATQKDKRGKALIKFFSEPQKNGEFNEPRDYVKEWTEFCEYCVTDNLVERQVDLKLSAFELKGLSLDTFLFDLRMNQRGIPINMEAAKNAQRVIDHVQGIIAKEFFKRTKLNVTQREAVRGLLGMPNMQAETVENTLLSLRSRINEAELLGLAEDGAKLKNKFELLSMYQKVSYAAVKKVRTMLNCACPDGRVRGGHRWYGTGPGRSSGQLLQPQNFKRTPPELRPVTKIVYDQICQGATADELETLYGEPIELISACIRQFIHDPSRQMLDGDYAAVQARIICWGAGQVDALNEYRQGIDRYKLMGGIIYGIPLGQVTPDQREVGKRAILGLGFQMGEEKFQSSCKIQYGLDLPLELCLKAKEAFRKKHNKIVDFWYKLNTSAKGAIRRPGEKNGVFVVRTIAGIKYLLMQLPSGRSIAYPYPQIDVEMVEGHTPTSFEDADLARAGEGAWRREQISYWGQLPMSTQWGRIKLYGGKLAENWTMGVEADIMGHGLIEAEKDGMPPFMLVHDQALAFPEGNQTPEQFAAALTRAPAWASGLPVVAECKFAQYYTK